MGFFDTEEGVQEYLELAKGHDGRELIGKLSEYLPANSTVLELGMGPGKDLELLSERYGVTGSDNSSLFIEKYRAVNPEADLLLLDAVTLKSHRRWDCLFSNKVLHHLERTDLEISIPRQADVLEEDGLLAHAFWYGSKVEEHGGLHFQYYEETDLDELFGNHFETVLMERYEELDPGDSIFVIARKR
jgi:trans-aconitate methyltransferase